MFERFDVVTGPADAPPIALPADVAAFVAEQDAAADAVVADQPGFTTKGRRVLLVPIPRPEVALRFGGTPLDSLSALHPIGGSGVPLMDHAGERPHTDASTRKRLRTGGPDAIVDYQQKHNRESIDGLPAVPALDPSRGLVI